MFALGETVYVPRFSHYQQWPDKEFITVYAPIQARVVLADDKTVLVAFENREKVIECLKFVPVGDVWKDRKEACRVLAERSAGWSEYPGIRFADLPTS